MTQDAENSAMGKFRMGKIIGDRWKIVQKLDEGGFGSVYKVQDIKDVKKFAALKVEPASSEEWNHLKVEVAVLKELHGAGMRAHVPHLFRSSKRRHYCYMIMTLLGENLKKLKDRHFPRGMPLRTWTRVGVQCLYGIKTMHDRGYVHRDIKPNNFVLGYAATPTYARVVYVIDFGLARNYAFPPATKGGKWIARRQRPRLEFRGTLRYAAPTMHEEKEQGRKDDVWAWLYMAIDLYCGLPWLDTDTQNGLVVKKLHMKDDDLMIRMPEELKFLPKHLRSLNVYQRPNYVKIYRALEKLRKATKTAYEDAYEWESKDQAEANRKAMYDKDTPVGYGNAEGFFKDDPIKLKAAPSASDEKIVTDRYITKKVKPEMIALEDVIGISAAAHRKPSPERKTHETPPTTPKSPGGQPRKKASRQDALQPLVVAGKRSSGERVTNPTVSPGNSKQSKRDGRTTVRKKTSKKEGVVNGSLEESDDFVPSCYMSIDIPLHYLHSPNEDAKDFQRKVVGMDWGHVEPPKQVVKDSVYAASSFSSAEAAKGGSNEASKETSKEKEASRELLQQPVAAAAAAAVQLQDAPSLLQQLQRSVLQPQQQMLLPQQPDSSDNSNGPPSGREPSPPPVAEKKASTSSIVSPTCSAACTIPHHGTEAAVQDTPSAVFGTGPKQPDGNDHSAHPPSSTSSVSIGLPRAPRTKKSAKGS